MADIILIETPITRERLQAIAAQLFGDMVKAVVDVEKGIMAAGADLHADEEAWLLDRGSAQEALWGINIYPDLPMPDAIEFDSMINIRPRQQNMSRTVENAAVITKIADIVSSIITE